MADSSVGMCLMKDNETLGVKLKSKNTETLGFEYVLMITSETIKDPALEKAQDQELTTTLNDLVFNVEAYK